METEFLLRQRISSLLLLAALTTFILTFDYFNLTANTLDYINHLASIENVKASLAQGILIPRVMMYDQSGWGYAYLQFYSNTAYLFSGAIELLLKLPNPLIAYWITLWCSLFIGSLYTYRLINSVMQSRLMAILGSTTYLAAPYFMTVIYSMNDFTEAVALGMLPAVFYYSHERYQQARLKNFLLASLAWYLLATSHLISFFYGSLFIGLFFLLMTLRTRRWKDLFNVGYSYIFGWVLASWFLAPTLLYKKYLNVEKLYGDSHIFTANKTALACLLSPWRLSETHPNLGLPMLCVILAGCFALFRNSKNNANFPVLLFLFFLIVFMVWAPVNFWQFMPRPFLAAQYSWRLLAQTVWIGPLLFAMTLGWLAGNKLKSRYVALGIILILLTSVIGLKIPSRNFQPVDTGNVRSNPTLRLNPRSYIANNNKIQNFIVSAANKIDVRETQTHCQKEAAITTCVINTSTAGELIELPILFYPDLLHITVNGKTVAYKAMLYENKSLAAVYSEAGSNIIKMQFKGLTWANNFSLFAWGLLLILCVWNLVVLFYEFLPARIFKAT